MAKFPSHIIERALDVGFSDEEINKAQKNMALEAFEQQIEDLEEQTGERRDGNIVEMDMTGQPERTVTLPQAATLSVLGEVDPSTLQRFEALCLLKGWDFGEHLTKVLEGLLTQEGFKREDKVE